MREISGCLCISIRLGGHGFLRHLKLDRPALGGEITLLGEGETEAPHLVMTLDNRRFARQSHDLVAQACCLLANGRLKRPVAIPDASDFPPAS